MKIFLVFYFLLFIAGTLLVDSFGHLLARAETPGGELADPAGEAPAPAAKTPRADKPAPAVKTASVALQKTAEPEPGLKLPPLPANLKASGKHQAWGFTKIRIITPSGELQGGTFLEFPNIDELPLMAWFFADRNWNGPLAVPEDKVILFGGTLDGADPADLRLFQRYYFLRGQLEPPASAMGGAVAAPAAPVAPANPFEEDYKAMVVKYIAFTNRTEVLTAERNKASGAARTKIIDEQKAMKLQESELIRDLKNAQEKYSDWKKKNPGAATNGTAKPATPPSSAAALDPATAAEYREELKRLEPGVRRILQ